MTFASRLGSGESYGRWTIERFSHKDRRNAYFVCRCECGAVSTVRRWSLVSGHSQSCGCRKVDLGRELGRHWGPINGPMPKRRQRRAS